MIKAIVLLYGDKEVDAVADTLLGDVGVDLIDYTDDKRLEILQLYCSGFVPFYLRYFKFRHEKWIESREDFYKTGVLRLYHHGRPISDYVEGAPDRLFSVVVDRAKYSSDEIKETYKNGTVIDMHPYKYRGEFRIYAVMKIREKKFRKKLWKMLTKVMCELL